ncbi:hypothetical protein HDV05_001996, partial [Chytridiales sp. JEL 0842]
LFYLDSLPQNISLPVSPTVSSLTNITVIGCPQNTSPLSGGLLKPLCPSACNAYAKTLVDALSANSDCLGLGSYELGLISSWTGSLCKAMSESNPYKFNVGCTMGNSVEAYQCGFQNKTLAEVYCRSVPDDSCCASPSIQGSSLPTTTIVGLAFGGLALIAVAVVALWCCAKRRGVALPQFHAPKFKRNQQGVRSPPPAEAEKTEAPKEAPREVAIQPPQPIPAPTKYESAESHAPAAALQTPPTSQPQPPTQPRYSMSTYNSNAYYEPPRNLDGSPGYLNSIHQAIYDHVPTTNPYGTYGTSKSYNTEQSTTPTQSTPRPPLPAVPTSQTQESFVPPWKPDEPPPARYVVVSAYVPKVEDEVVLLEGDCVTLDTIYRDGWTKGYNERTGEYGFIPMGVLKALSN